ncbi:MBL fold metallo-hydrolase [Plantactinospora sp. WMMB782]|uniref:MBL fold metallo-hydrolase n=1 Tax=Plantactinospora sp. WMMB782 TaxID=3404121 RepID=UPI003B9279E4
MLVAGFPADAFGTNCYVLATAPGEQCVVVDPGIGVLDQLDDVLAEHRLRPAAVLLTHGHLDHTFSVAPVCGARGIPAYVHPADRELLADPAKGLSTELAQLFGGRLPYTEPEDVAELTDGATLALAGLEITVDHAPGHTGGSVLFRLPGTGPAVRSGLPLPPGVDWAAEQICLAGDVLFAGSIGRTDLPGGNPSTMVRSLREKILPLADDTVVLPGHGPATSIGRERASNPYLIEAAGLDGPAVAPSRGW